jgi:hypothetical protein
MIDTNMIQHYAQEIMKRLQIIVKITKASDLFLRFMNQYCINYINISQIPYPIIEEGIQICTKIQEYDIVSESEKPQVIVAAVMIWLFWLYPQLLSSTAVVVGSLSSSSTTTTSAVTTISSSSDTGSTMTPPPPPPPLLLLSDIAQCCYITTTGSIRSMIQRLYASLPLILSQHVLPRLTQFHQSYQQYILGKSMAMMESIEDSSVSSSQKAGSKKRSHKMMKEGAATTATTVKFNVDELIDKQGQIVSLFYQYRLSSSSSSSMSQSSNSSDMISENVSGKIEKEE